MNVLTSIIHGAPKVAIINGVILLVVVGWPLWVFGRIWRAVKKKTEESANAWLAIIDGGNYAQSWELAAASFRHRISKEEWVGRLENEPETTG